MANEPLPNQVPDIALPDLKKKKKEKKRSGAAWGSGGQGAEAFEGATGGIGRGAASSAAAAAEGAAEAGAEFGAELGAEAAAEGAASEAGLFGRLFGRLVSSLADMLGSTLAAQIVVGLGAAALVLGAAAMAAYLAGWGRGGKGHGMLDLGGIADNLHLGHDGSSGLDFAKGIGHGLFGDGKAGQAAKGGEQGKDGAQAKNGDGADGKGGNPGAAPNDGNDNAFGERPDADRLAHNLSGAKLSTDLGGGSSMGGAFAKIDQGFSRSPNGFGKGPANDHGKAAALRQAIHADTHGLNLGRRGIRANRALGQLRSMSPMGSEMTTAATTEEAGQAATTQFEGSAPIGGQAPTTPAGLGGTTPTGLGGNGPGNINPGDVCNDPDPNNCIKGNAPGVDMTQAIGQMVQAAKQELDMAKNILLAMGIIVLAMELIAAAWFCTCCAFIGWIFMAIALILAVVAVMIAHMMADMVHQQANAIRQAGQNLGTDGGKSPQADLIADQIDKMGNDIGSVNMGIMLGGISAFVGFSKVNSDESHLQDMDQNIENAGNTPVNQTTTQATHDPAKPVVPKPKPGQTP